MQRQATCGLQQRLFARRATIVVTSSAQSPLFSLCVGAGLTSDTMAEPRAADRDMEHSAPLYSAFARDNRLLFFILCHNGRHNTPVLANG